MKILWVLFFILELSIVGYCQYSILSGNIYDSYGALIPFAQIKAVTKDNKVYVTNANDEGTYELKLPADFYTIEFNSINFESVHY
ncbi:hypothetical protein BH20ACI1_BH20ACI1_12520 [soil metagenome]